MGITPTMQICAIAVIGSMFITQTALGHGYAEYPAARAQICDTDGGYWDSQDGSTIPNAACRAAFLQSGAFQFYQKPEFSITVQDYNSITAVKAAMPGGQVCSANDNAKSGTSLAHADWQKTSIDTTQNGGIIQYTYKANTPHTPSFWEFYITEAGFDSATSQVSWNDLELIQSNGNTATTEINGQKYYVIDLQLPTDRSGDAVLFSRWQRVDPGGEGFYNCSDITLVNDGTSPSWFSQGALLSSNDDAKSGDEVWGRVFNALGQETVFEKLTIDANNEIESLWAVTLANQISNANRNVQVGVMDQSGDIILNSDDIYANLVFSRAENDSYQLSIRSPVVTNHAPTAAVSLDKTSIDIGQTLTATINMTDVDGDSLNVSYADGQGDLLVDIVPGPSYPIATYVVTGSIPGQHSIEILISDGIDTIGLSANYLVTSPTTGECTDPKASDYPIWVPGNYTNQMVSHNGLVYQANWWTNAEPGTNGSWTVLSDVNLPWDANSIYNSGEEVDHGISRYRAAYWTQGNNPEIGAPWSRVGNAVGC